MAVDTLPSSYSIGQKRPELVFKNMVIFMAYDHSITYNNTAASRMASYLQDSPPHERKKYPSVSMGPRTVSKTFISRMFLAIPEYLLPTHTSENHVKTVKLQTAKGDIILAVSDSNDVHVEPAGKLTRNSELVVETQDTIKARLPTHIQEVDISTLYGNLTGVISTAGDYTVWNGTINVEIKSALPVLVNAHNNCTLTHTGYTRSAPLNPTGSTESTEETEYHPTGHASSLKPGRIKLIAKTAKSKITFKFDQ